jgi:transcriptional regulator
LAASVSDKCGGILAAVASDFFGNQPGSHDPFVHPIDPWKHVMYIPAAFCETDTARLHEFLHEHSFALLTTHGKGGLVGSHLPLLIDPTRGPFGTLAGHFAKGNEQVQDAGAECLAVFSGPHAYISPTWYETPNTVPTWNYVAVHAYGTLRLIDDKDELARILKVMVEKYEGHRTQPWPFDAGTDFHQKLLDGIVGFEIEITRLEGKWKLNQNHPPERRQRVIAALNAAGGENNEAVAKLMQLDSR